MEEVIEDFYTDETVDMLSLLEYEYKLQQFLKNEGEIIWDSL